MNYRLFIVGEAIEFMLSLTKRDRGMIRNHLEKIRDFPSHYAEYERRDAVGRAIAGCVVGRFAIEYWEDGADQDLKVTHIGWADR
jgi:hypothetical protein